MTDNEIIKALECCLSNNYEDCRKCLLLNSTDDYLECRDNLLKATLNLISQQKAEIERLEHLTNTQNIMIDELNKACKNIKANSIKDFAERLKDKHKHNTTSVVSLVTVFDNINNLVKKMTESESEKNE